MAQMSDERFNLALDLFIESLYKPDHELRSQAKDLGCLDELMIIRQKCIKHCKDRRV